MGPTTGPTSGPTNAPNTSTISLVLVDTVTGGDIISPLVQGSIISRKRISVRADVTGTVGYVIFEFDGTPVHKTETIPFAIVSASSRLANVANPSAALMSLLPLCCPLMLVFFYRYFSLKAEYSPPNLYTDFKLLEANGSHSIGVSTFTAGGTLLDHLLLTVDAQMNNVLLAAAPIG
jgi:hypothetical protein